MIREQVAEEIKRLDGELLVAESILSVVAPTEKTVSGAFPILKVVELALDAHIRELHQIRDKLAAIAMEMTSSCCLGCGSINDGHCGSINARSRHEQGKTLES